MHTQDWVKAEELSTQVINSTTYSLVGDLNGVFLKNSQEAIWQLQPVNPVYNTWEGSATITSATANPTYLLTSHLYNSFESGDNRKTAWVGSKVIGGQPYFFPLKYKIQGGNSGPVTEYYMILRLAEQYLIRAEARARQNNIAGAQADLNKIRNRAGLSNTAASDLTSMLSAVESERRIELMVEWGHRWFDLKRTNRATAVLSVIKGATWSANDTLWPIPTPQINLNPKLTQNPGYRMIAPKSTRQ
jgi:hypothetical protein